MKPYFQHFITSEEELRARIGTPSERASKKVIHHLDEGCQQFIAHSPFLTIATANDKGICDSSPRGDMPGFVYVLDENVLVIPERPGNKRGDSIKNILTNPHVGLIFFIPGISESLRVNGKASIICDEDVLEKMKVNDKLPLMGIAVEVEECFMHCGKALKRSNLWEPSTWLREEEQPNTAQILSTHVKIPEMTPERLKADFEEGYKTKLY
ncbi:pyridoxamine 5'-phosphate oxidase family protein [Priestia koreensis]|uniref:pyridoxamine 5'-phosphate oxidase family protein n=1 Tax=Priestia koreensis TaxID=284581 RepID=UPI001F57D400|nr:pyridoxamine 5'-phosphate oxidase family protein [Priestia koreensis]UNL83172.1 pyridoxamine 5'-phosphate oxidase family protein [Priestia koreensis]